MKHGSRKWILNMVLLGITIMVISQIANAGCTEQEAYLLVKEGVKHYILNSPNPLLSKSELNKVISEYAAGNYEYVCDFMERIPTGSNCGAYNSGECDADGPLLCVDGLWVQDMKTCCRAEDILDNPPRWIDMDGQYPGCECYQTELIESICNDGADNDCDGLTDEYDCDCINLNLSGTEDMNTFVLNWTATAREDFTAYDILRKGVGGYAHIGAITESSKTGFYVPHAEYKDGDNYFNLTINGTASQCSEAIYINKKSADPNCTKMEYDYNSFQVNLDWKKCTYTGIGFEKYVVVWSKDYKPPTPYLDTIVTDIDNPTKASYSIGTDYYTPGENYYIVYTITDEANLDTQYVSVTKGGGPLS